MRTGTTNRSASLGRRAHEQAAQLLHVTHSGPQYQTGAGAASRGMGCGLAISSNERTDRTARLHLRVRACCCVRRWLLLAWMPAALSKTEDACFFLGHKNGAESGTRCLRECRTETTRVDSTPILGARRRQTFAAIAVAYPEKRGTRPP